MTRFFPCLLVIMALSALLSPAAKAQSSLYTAWDDLPDLLNIGVDDGDQFTVSVSGTSNPGEGFFVDFTVRSTNPGRGYQFYFGPSTTFLLGPEVDTTGFIGTLMYTADGSETDMGFTLADRFDENSNEDDTIFDLTNFSSSSSDIVETSGTGNVPIFDLNVLISTSTGGYAMVSGVRQGTFHHFRHLIDALWARQQSNRLGNVTFSDSNPVATSGTGSGGSFADVFDSLRNGVEQPVGMTVLPPTDSPWRGFVLSSGTSFDQESGLNNPGQSGESWSGAAGLERVLNPHLLIGAAISGGDSDSDVANLATIEVEGVAGHLYGTYQSEGFYVDARYAIGSLDADASRFAAPGLTARSSTDSLNHAVYFETGRQVQVGQWTTGPYLGLDYLSGEIDAFAENGAGRFNLLVNEQNYDSLVGKIGWELSRQQTRQWGTLASKVRAGWNHEFLDGVGGNAGFGYETSPVGRLIGGNFVPRGTPLTGSFAIEEPGDDYLALGVGLAAEVTEAGLFESCRIGLNYESQLFREDFFEHYLSGQITFRF